MDIQYILQFLSIMKQLVVKTNSDVVCCFQTSQLLQGFASLHFGVTIYFGSINLRRQYRSCAVNEIIFQKHLAPWYKAVRVLEWPSFCIHTILYCDLLLQEPKVKLKFGQALKLMYLQRFWTGIVLGIVIVLIFESFFFALLASVSLGNKNGCKCQHYDYA